MATKTRQLIIETAQRLFNERGLDGVSIGDIAAEMKISKGNITYYFSRKQDILEAIVMQGSYAPTNTEPTTLEGLIDMMLEAQEIASQNIFYFKHYAQIAQTSPCIHDIQRKIHATHTKSVINALAAMEADGLALPELYPGQREQIADGFFLTLAYWIPFSDLREDDGISPIMECVGLLSLLLTHEGRLELLRLSKEKYSDHLIRAAAIADEVLAAEQDK